MKQATFNSRLHQLQAELKRIKQGKYVCLNDLQALRADIDSLRRSVHKQAQRKYKKLPVADIFPPKSLVSSTLPDIEINCGSVYKR
jgi:hypothetical protein